MKKKFISENFIALIITLILGLLASAGLSVIIIVGMVSSGDIEYIDKGLIETYEIRALDNSEDLLKMIENGKVEFIKVSEKGALNYEELDLDNVELIESNFDTLRMYKYQLDYDKKIEWLIPEREKFITEIQIPKEMINKDLFEKIKEEKGE